MFLLSGSVNLSDYIPYIIVGGLVVLAILIMIGILSHKSKKKRRLADNAGATEREMKKTETNKVLEEKAQLKEAEKTATYLKELAKDFPTLVKKLDKIIDQLKYANPSSKKQVEKIDSKIKSELDDTKISLSRQKIHEEDVDEMLENVFRLIAERKSII